MMEDHEFCDDCPGCRPRLAKLEDGKAIPVPLDDPAQQKIDHIWDNNTTYAQRRSYIEVTLHNSRNPVDMQRCQEVVDMFTEGAFQ